MYTVIYIYIYIYIYTSINMASMMLRGEADSRIPIGEDRREIA